MRITISEFHAFPTPNLIALFSVFSQTDADPEVCKRMCRVNHSEPVMSLVSYYQMVSGASPVSTLFTHYERTAVRDYLRFGNPHTSFCLHLKENSCGIICE